MLKAALLAIFVLKTAVVSLDGEYICNFAALAKDPAGLFSC